MQPTPIVRPSWFALHRRTLLSVVAMSAIGAAGVWYLDQRPATTMVVPSIVTVPITTPVAPAPIVNVTVAPPVPLPIEPAPNLDDPRALTPYLDAGCISQTSVESTDEGPMLKATCRWDAGFPAISADGKTIAVQTSESNGGRGWMSTSILFIDAATSKVKSSQLLVTVDEVEGEGLPNDVTFALVSKRIAPLQARLEAGAYRTLRALPTDPDVAGLRLEQPEGGDSIRVVDTAANIVVWRGEFDVTKEYPTRATDPDSDADPGCYPSYVNTISAWFDPSTRALIFEVPYGGGPCYCGDAIHYYVRRAATD